MHLSGNCSGGDYFCDMAKKGLSTKGGIAISFCFPNMSAHGRRGPFESRMLGPPFLAIANHHRSRRLCCLVVFMKLCTTGSRRAKNIEGSSVLLWMIMSEDFSEE